jgi:hypothetical protein
MQDKLERLIGIVYKKWKSGKPRIKEAHPDEETFVCFLEGRLSFEEAAGIKNHLINCDSCAEVLAIQAKLKADESKEVPTELVERVKNLVPEQKSPVLEILLKLKEKFLEILDTNGDVLVGREFMPAPILRGHKIKDFKDEVTILKDFKNLRIEVKIENKSAGVFNLTVIAKEKETQKMIKDLRITLMKEDLEMESYLADSGRVTFEHVLLGKYTVEISSTENKLASILVDIRI